MSFRHLIRPTFAHEGGTYGLNCERHRSLLSQDFFFFWGGGGGGVEG